MSKTDQEDSILNVKIKSIDDENITSGDLVKFSEGCKFYERVFAQKTGKLKKLYIRHLKEEKIMFILDVDCDEYKNHENSVYKTLYKNKVYYMSKKPVEHIDDTNKLLYPRLDICITHLEKNKKVR